MHMFRKLSAQAIACVVLSSHVIGVDGAPDPAQPSTPPRTPQRPLLPIASPMASPSDKIPDRRWFFEENVVIGDLEFDPVLGGEITEAAFYEIHNGQYANSFHTYVQTLKKVNNPHVMPTFPVDLTQQPTFAQSAPRIATILNNKIFYSWGPADPNKLAQHLRMQGGANGSIPTGTTVEFEYADGLAMEKRDELRRMGQVVASPARKKFTIVVESPTKVKAELEAKRKENKKKSKEREKRKENRDLDREIQVLAAKARGQATPKRKERKKSLLSGTSFKQGEVIKRKGLSAALGASAIGEEANQLRKKNKVHPTHVKSHHAHEDTLEAIALATAQAQPTARRQIRREKEEENERKREIEKTEQRNALRDITKELNFDDIYDVEFFGDSLDEDRDAIPFANDEVKLKRERSLGKAEKVMNSQDEGFDIIDDVQVPSPVKKRFRALNPDENQ